MAYNYFESKDDLIGAALDRMAQRIADSATSIADPHDALLVMLDMMYAIPAFPGSCRGSYSKEETFPR